MQDQNWKGEKKMAIINQIKEVLEESQQEEMRSAVNDLRELGVLLEESDPHFFEEEKFELILKQVREIMEEND